MVIPNIRILELVVLENVLEEAITILLIFMIIIINTTKVLQGNDVIFFVGVFITI